MNELPIGIYDIPKDCLAVVQGNKVEIRKKKNLPLEPPQYRCKDCRHFVEGHATFSPRWTIEDAKDGDVLVSKYNKPFIYNGNYNDRFVDAHCGLNFDGKFKLAWENCSWTNNKNIHPASEEQCGLLSQKMKEAGYEWDMEKKELKLLISNGGDFESNNSKQNPTWSEEDDAYELFAISAVEDYYDEKNPLQKGLVDWLKSLKERLSK